ncbi:MAG: insulinase family protein [Cyanobacteria bacterium]|nr:insulinase family protein [Cyanobacteriota bacterium]
MISRQILRHWSPLLMAFILVLICLSCAQQNARAAASDIKTLVLPNGQHLYLDVRHDQPIVTIDTWVQTGSVNEDKEFNGVSHFLEHLLFKGTPSHSAIEINRLLESKGAEFNAATSDDFTHYHITTASPFFQDALTLHADMLLNSTFPPDELDRERAVVQEEINRANDTPFRKLFQRLNQTLYGTHPYALDTLGPKSNIASIPRDHILDYYHTWYQPSHMHTVIVGDIDPEKTIQAVQAAFSKPSAVPQSATSHYHAVPVGKPIAPDSPQVVIQEDPSITQAYYGLAFLGPSIEERSDTYALDVAMQALGSGRSGRLYQSLKEQKNIVNSITAGNGTQKYSGLLYVFAELEPKKLDELTYSLFTMLSELKQKGITQGELDKIKTQTIKNYVFNNESTEGVAENIGYNVTIGKLSDYTDYVSNIQKVSLADVQAALNKYLNWPHSVVTLLVPKGSALDASALKASLIALNEGKACPCKLSKTTPTAPEAVAHSPIQKRVLQNGMTVIVKTRPETDTVAVKLLIRGGQLAEPVPGVASLTAQVLMKGTQTLSTEALHEALEAKGMQLSVAARPESLEVTAQSVKEDFPELFMLMADVLTHPALRESDVAQEKETLRQAITASHDSPSTIAIENLSMALYPTHPYGNVGSRVLSHLSLLNQDYVKHFVQDTVVPNNMIVSVVGNVSPETIFRIFESSFPATLNAQSQLKQSPLEGGDPVTPIAKSKDIEASKPNQSATWIAKGWLGPDSHSKDAMSFRVLNSLLGSGLSSRLFTDIREKEGLAYTVSSSFSTRKDKGSFTMFLGTDPKNQARVLVKFDQEIKRLQTEPVPAQELQEAKDKLTGTFALAHETNESQAGYLALYELLGLGYEFDNRFSTLAQKVTAKDLQSVARQYLSKPSILSLVAPTTVSQNSQKAPTGKTTP